MVYHFSGCVFQSRSLLGRREVEENRCASSLAVGAEGPKGHGVVDFFWLAIE
jgi:hypothetical protein